MAAHWSTAVIIYTQDNKLVLFRIKKYNNVDFMFISKMMMPSLVNQQKEESKTCPKFGEDWTK